jgi:hypothetical protein
MSQMSEADGTVAPSVRRRWFVALDPIFEGGRRGRRAETWDVEDELVAIALGGDMTLDLRQTKTSPAQVAIDAYALLRDVEVIVPAGTDVQLVGEVVRGRLRNDAQSPAEGQVERIVKVYGHCLLGDVNVRSA